MERAGVPGKVIRKPNGGGVLGSLRKLVTQRPSPRQLVSRRPRIGIAMTGDVATFEAFRAVGFRDLWEGVHIRVARA